MSATAGEEPAVTDAGPSMLRRAWEATRNGAIGGAVVGLLTMRFQNVVYGALICGALGGGVSLYNSLRAKWKSPSPAPE